MAFGRNRNRRRADKSGEARPAEHAWGRLLRLFFGLAVLAGCGAGALWLYGWAQRSPAFALQRITFHGLSRASEADLCRLAGVSAGQNLWQLDVDPIARAMTSHPWVRQVELTRRLPAALEVRVLEHEPAALVALGDLYVLDREGEPFKRVQVGDGLDLPLVTGVGREAYMANPTQSAERFRAALALAELYEKSLRGTSGAPLASAEQLAEVRVGEEGFALVTASGLEIRLGDGPAEDKLQRLQRVRSELSRRALTAEVIHLDNRVRPGWVSVKLSTPR